MIVRQSIRMITLNFIRIIEAISHKKTQAEIFLPLIKGWTGSTPLHPLILHEIFPVETY